jgi:L-amino acid N-acyltransferase YncA
MGEDAAILRAVSLRDATADDAAAIAALYAYYVRASVATFEEIEPGAADIAQRIAAVQSAGLPWLVATADNGALLGYACAAPYRSRSAYRYTLENSVYIARETQRRGVGALLMREVIARCASAGYRQMIAVIGDSANAASIGLHARLGFAMVGTHPAVGFKHGRWVDVVHMQLALARGATTPP